MQRIEFLNNLETLISRLKSKKIADTFRQGFNTPGTPFDYAQIKPILFESKSQFDQLLLDEKLGAFLKKINGIDIYDEKNLSALTSVLNQQLATQILVSNLGSKFYSFHSSLLDLLNISKDLLSNNIINKNHDENLNDGVLIFQVKIESNGLPSSTYIKILSHLEDLVRTVEKVLKLEPTEAEVVLLDSGSDTNIGIETKVEIAKTIFQIFKEIWEFITSLRFYRAQQRNQALLESLSVRKDILKYVDDGIITENEAKEYIHIIKSRTDDLIGMKVLPRVLLNYDNQMDNIKILEEYRIKVLEEKVK